MSANFTQAMESCNINDSENIPGDDESTLDRSTARTWNNAVSNPSPDSTGETAGRLALFFKSVRGLGGNRLQAYLEKAYAENPRDTFLIAFHIRDCRGGKGEREIGRAALRWLSRDKERFRAVIQHIAEYGRWDDYLTLIQPLEKPKPSRKSKSGAVKAKSPGDEVIAFIDGLDEARKKELASVSDPELVDALIGAFADQLKRDLCSMNEGKPCTLAAKWAPTENCALDRKYDAVAKIAKTLAVSKRNYRKQYLAPLRAYLKVVERYMCHKNWEAIDYSAVPSCAMKRLKKAFAKNDATRFEEWKAKLQKGEVKVNAKQLYPHELVREVYASSENVVSEAQWKVLVEETKKLGVFEKSAVVVDVSGSMGTMGASSFCPLHASVALGLIISECIQGPLRDHIITFHELPSFHLVEGSTLKERIGSLVQASWGGSTNFQAIFDLILSRAKKHELKQEDMPRTLYVLSDMQFNSAMSMKGEEKTNYQTVRDKYQAAGYQPPDIIFWNLNGQSTDFPCTTNDFGTAMISGFSTAILKSILSLGKVEPLDVMRASIEAARYEPISRSLRPFEPEEKMETKEEAPSGWFGGWFGSKA